MLKAALLLLPGVAAVPTNNVIRFQHELAVSDGLASSEGLPALLSDAAGPLLGDVQSVSLEAGNHASMHRRLQANVLSVTYIVRCGGTTCSAISSQLASISSGAAGTAFATAMIDAISAAAADAGFANAVLSTPADVVATISAPDTVNIGLPPAPAPGFVPGEGPLTVATQMIEAANCGTAIAVGTPIAGFPTVACHTDANQHGECQLGITRGDGTALNDGDTYVPGETLNIDMVSECAGMALGDDNTCSDYGREWMIELDGGTFDIGAGTRGCSNTRIVNPFRVPTMRAPDSGTLTIRGGVGYCHGTEVNGVVTSTCSSEFHLAAEITLTSGGGGGSSPTPAPTTNEVATAVTTMSVAPAGWTTYQLTVDLPAGATNIYALAGTPSHAVGISNPLVLPAAFQAAPPFGVHVGGVDPAITAANPGAGGAYDSWITVGATDGSAGDGLALSPGLSDALDAWTADTGFESDNAAAFFMNPNDGPSGNGIVMAQVTIAAGTSATASGVIQGQSAVGNDYQDHVAWTIMPGTG